MTGANGFVGSHFVDRSSEFDLLTPSSKELDLTNLEAVKEYIAKHDPDWIVNFAAFTDVNKAEEQKGDKTGTAWQSNVEAVKNLLEAFARPNFIQISTDMVFSGSENNPGPYKETDTPPEDENVLTWYGWTKNRGEKLVKEAGGTVVRIIYPISLEFDKKTDYLKGPVKRFAAGKMYPLFADQQVSVSYVEEVAEAIKRIITKDLRGVFHVSSDTTTPFDLIKNALETMGEDASGVKSSSVVEFLKTQLNKARYPIFGGLDAKMTAEKLEMQFSSWKQVLSKLPAKVIGPRRYQNLDVANAVTIDSTKYFSKPEGYVMETADYTELGYFLGYKFEPRCSYSIWSPENILRGGHLERRSKVVTITRGYVYYAIIDLREGETYKKVSEFYLGDGERSIGKSVLVPEGVVDIFMAIGGPVATHQVADKPFSRFDNRITLDVCDPALNLHLPVGMEHSHQVNEEHEILGLEDFIKKAKI